MSTPAAEPLPRLLRGVGIDPIHQLDVHQAHHGALPELRRIPPEAIVSEIEASGLRGHGGAAFPAARKLRAVATGRGPKYVVVNATEGEPRSDKDHVLMREAPHLVLDGAAVAARAVGAKTVFVAVSESVPDAVRRVTRAIDERSRRFPREPDFSLVETPEAFIAGQESALVNLLDGGAAAPQWNSRPYERGVRGRATLVQNAETVAHMAMIVRFGAPWFRSLGSEHDPGSALVTLSGAVENPGVYEIEQGMALSELLATAGPTEAPAAILIGGYFGTWLAAEAIPGVRLAPEQLRPFGASLGAGVISVLGRSACPIAETVRIGHWLAEQSAGQCGPCVHGLAAVAETLSELASGRAHRTHAYGSLRRWLAEIPGRGACHHPDGAVRFMRSALAAFPLELEQHAMHGRCPRCAGRPHAASLAAPKR